MGRGRRSTTSARPTSWMRDFAPNPDGTYPFQPSTIETRKYFARAVVMAFAPTETVDPSITFADLDPSDAFYPAANIAVKLHWMKKTAAGTFAPDKPVTMTMVHRVLTLALGLGAGDQVPEPPAHRRRCRRSISRRTSARSILGMRLGLRYNSSDESNDVGPTTPLSRAQVAYSLYRAATQPSWNVPSADRAVPGHRAAVAHARPARRSCSGASSTWASRTCGAASGASRRRRTARRSPASTARASRGGSCARATARTGTSPPRGRTSDGICRSERRRTWRRSASCRTSSSGPAT